MAVLCNLVFLFLVLPHITNLVVPEVTVNVVIECFYLVFGCGELDVLGSGGVVQWPDHLVYRRHGWVGSVGVTYNHTTHQDSSTAGGQINTSGDTVTHATMLTDLPLCTKLPQ